MAADSILEFYQAVSRDETISPADRIRARRSLDDLCGLCEPQRQQVEMTATVEVHVDWLTLIHAPKVLASRGEEALENFVKSVRARPGSKAAIRSAIAAANAPKPSAVEIAGTARETFTAICSKSGEVAWRRAPSGGTGERTKWA